MRLSGSARAKSSFVTVSHRVGRAVAGERDTHACEMLTIMKMITGSIVSYHPFEVIFFLLAEARCTIRSHDASKCAIRPCINKGSERWRAITDDDALSILSRIPALRQLRESFLQVQLPRADDPKQKYGELAGCIQWLRRNALPRLRRGLCEQCFGIRLLLVAIVWTVDTLCVCRAAGSETR
jgi:hypothetical protein